MFIEVTEYLRCPQAHDAEWLVLAADAMADRHVIRGTLGCPACQAEYAIRDGIVRFGAPPATPPPGPLPAADVVQALIGLESPGGYVALVGSAASLTAGLQRSMPGVHFVIINASANPGGGCSMIETSAGLPLRDRVVRGVVLGGEVAESLLAEARRVVLNGQRVVALSETIRPTDQLEELARGQGLWVGRRR